MLTKTLKKMEVDLGFIHIPAKYKAELIGNTPTPFNTKVNNTPARVDKYGRIWSDFLKKKYPVGTQVTISKNNGGFQIATYKQKQEINTLKTTQVQETISSKANMSDRDFRNEVLEEECIKHLKEKSLEAFYKENPETPKSKPYFQGNALRIYHDDILKTKAVEKNTVDLIVTSPPYGVEIQYENYDDSIPYSQYLSFTKKWLERCYDFSKDDGRLCLNVPLDKNKGGQQSVYADVTHLAEEVGWQYQSTVIWNEQNISRRTAWGSWLSASAPFVIAPVEVIVIMYKRFWRKLQKGKSDIKKKEFIEWTNGVWNFSGESKNRIGHPAPFPIELPKRCIKLFSYVGSIVLDPFLGSGTTLLACLETNRVGIGIEINKNYCDLAIKRLKKSGLYQKKIIENFEQSTP